MQAAIQNQQYRTSNAGSNMQASQKLCRPTDYADQQIMQNQQYACSNTEPAMQATICRHLKNYADQQIMQNQQYAGSNAGISNSTMCLKLSSLL